MSSKEWRENFQSEKNFTLKYICQREGEKTSLYVRKRKKATDFVKDILFPGYKARARVSFPV